MDTVPCVSLKKRMKAVLEAPSREDKKSRAAFGEAGLRQRRRKLVDRLAQRIIAGGGFAIIASVIAILFFITLEVWPLFRPARVTLLNTFPLARLTGEADLTDLEVLAAGAEDNLEIGYLILSNGSVRFFSLEDGSPTGEISPDAIHGGHVTSVWQSLDGKRVGLGTDEGSVLELSVLFNSSFSGTRRTYAPSAEEKEMFHLDPEKHALTALALAGDPEGALGVAAITEDDRVLLLLQQKKETLLGGVEILSASHTLESRWRGRPLSIALDGGLQNLYVGTGDGRICHFHVDLEQPPEFLGSVKVTEDGVGVTILSFLVGERTLVAGDAKGGVGAYALVRDESSPRGRRLVRIHEMGSHRDAVAALVPSARGKGFLSADRKGDILLQHTTSERVLARFGGETESPVTFVHFSPKANAALALDGERTLTYWGIENPHPEAGFGAFFRKVWYEGYDEPAYVWQSSAATDDFEPKLSFVPLFFGSMKGTLYALILAVPLAILAALYTSQFMHPAFRNFVKPTVEIMAALPSVVLGFLAGLWLAPIIEKVVPGVLLMLVVLPLSILGCSLAWRKAPQAIRGRLRPGAEIMLIIPLIILGIWLSLSMNASIERFLFEGNFTQWLFETIGERYDQRNALVVGFAMGFAVIPIIYTISEDALANVPRHLISGSLALGATRWQTAVRVAVPTAAAGIFSAVMIGFGRAVGETMIVLMATGNTPIMDWNMFNGFRTLSANIAVEIPEAPYGGTLYRLLFLTALLLFVMTFIVNTVAELVRQRVREKYQKL
jgi:phosphate transport system permease protein